MQEIVAYKTQKTVRLLTHRIGVTLAIIRFLRYYKSSFFPSSSLKFSPTAELRKIGRCDGMVDVADSKSAGGNSVWVRVPPPAPKREAKKDIEDKTSVFSRLPRPVDQQIYGPYFSDILPCAIHSGRSRTHTIFTLSGISFEAGILLLQDLGLFYSAVETDSPNRKQKNVRLLYGATIF